MSIEYSASLPQRIEVFLYNPQENKVMFCKRYKAENIWDIGIGAVLDLSMKPHPHFISICQQLYSESNEWFVGDIDALLGHSISK